MLCDIAFFKKVPEVVGGEHKSTRDTSKAQYGVKTLEPRPFCPNSARRPQQRPQHGEHGVGVPFHAVPCAENTSGFGGTVSCCESPMHVGAHGICAALQPM